MAVDLAETPRPPKETVRTSHKIFLTKSDLPWLPSERHEVHLVNMRRGAADFLFGSAIQGSNLVDAADQLDEHRSEICNNLLYTHLPQFSEGFNPQVSILKNGVTRQPIFYVSNNGGQRVYFMRFGRVESKAVIVKIAACDKAREVQVLKLVENLKI